MIEIGALVLAVIAFIVCAINGKKIDELKDSSQADENKRDFEAYRGDADLRMKVMADNIKALGVRCDSLSAVAEAPMEKPAKKSTKSAPKRDKNGKFTSK